MKTALVLLAALACGCQPPVVRESPRPETTAARAGGTIDVTVRAPTRAVWAASTLGTPNPTQRIVVTNHSPEDVDVENLLSVFSLSHGAEGMARPLQLGRS